VKLHISENEAPLQIWLNQIDHCEKFVSEHFMHHALIIKDGDKITLARFRKELFRSHQRIEMSERLVKQLDKEFTRKGYTTVFDHNLCLKFCT